MINVDERIAGQARNDRTEKGGLRVSPQRQDREIEEAIAREKQLKNWKREWKNKLIEAVNLEWKDLSLEWNLENERD
jgi:predicted GIY-YIG superfamily endonuclease